MHQLRAVSLRSYLDVAAFVGVDGFRLLAEAGISPLDLASGENRLPAGAVVDLLENSAAQSGCDAFAIHMARCRSFQSLGAFSLLAQHLPTVGAVVDAMRSFSSLFNDVLVIDRERAGDTSLLVFEVLPAFRKPQLSDLSVALGYLMLVGASQGRWEPETVHFTHGRPRDLAVFREYFRTRLEFDSAFNGLSCPTRDLAIALPRADRELALHARRLLKSVPVPSPEATLSEHVMQSISLLLPRGRATVKLVAANIGQSVRALQRGLEEEGKAFGALLNEVRRSEAQQRLIHSRLELTSLAAHLGYATPSSFSRWFRGEFGMSPSAWREAKRADANGPPHR